LQNCGQLPPVAEIYILAGKITKHTMFTQISATLQ